jgi:hypothetical protein
MDAYLVERYLPGWSAARIRDALARVQEACAELSASGTEIRYLGSMLLPVEESAFCRFDSAGAEAIAEVNERAQLPYARITAGVAIAPDDFLTNQSSIGGRSR